MNLIGDLNAIISILIFILASIFALFLYFRTGRHELVDDEMLFDSAIVGLIGALLGGRLVDFLLRPDFFNFSLSKLFFFNVYSGFDWYGAILGAVAATYILLRKKHISFWFILDLMSAPLVFGAILVSIGNLALFGGSSHLIFASSLLVIFWILKRLAKIRRKAGYFFSLSLILIGILNLSFITVKDGKYRVWSVAEYNLVLPLLVLLIGLVLFYALSARKIKSDIRNLGGLFLLGLFKVRRILFSASEANSVAKFILFSPLYLSKFVFDLVKLLGREIQMSVVELAQVFGVKR